MARDDDPPHVLVVADDLMWSTRLLSQARAAGAAADATRDMGGLRLAMAAGLPALVIVDLSGRAFDAVEAVAQATTAGARVMAVAQHEDLDLRRRALAAGASRVYAYGKVHADGVALFRRWLSGSEEAPAETAAASHPG